MNKAQISIARDVCEQGMQARADKQVGQKGRQGS
jgi:hypothetical protein